MSYDISDYVDVKTRIELLYKKFENASIQFEFKGVMDGNPEFIWGIAYVYRHPEDPRPATGTCSELAQGKTAFTRGSELANLETSAIGRAIGALGIGLGKSMATKQEVNSAKARQVEPTVTEKKQTLGLYQKTQTYRLAYMGLCAVKQGLRKTVSLMRVMSAP
jgi:hypothetical protein